MAGRGRRNVVALEDRWRQNGVEHVFFAQVDCVLLLLIVGFSQSELASWKRA